MVSEKVRQEVVQCCRSRNSSSERDFDLGLAHLVVVKAEGSE